MKEEKSSYFTLVNTVLISILLILLIVFYRTLYFKQKYMLRDIRGMFTDVNSAIYRIEVVTGANGLDNISRLPRAVGDLRIKQRACLALLVRFDELAKKHNIEYWLEGGTLLGAVRHGGFIPWDDDIDISVRREEYERLIPILKEEFTDGGFHIRGIGITKLLYKNSTSAVDIFPMDEGYDKKYPNSSRVRFLGKKLPKLRRKFSKESGSCAGNSSCLAKIRDKLYDPKNRKDGHNNFLFYGIESECCVRKSESRIIYNHDAVFPLKEIYFEGYKFPAVNNPNYYLETMYGDYWSYPLSPMPEHTGKPMTDEERMDSLELIDMYLERE